MTPGRKAPIAVRCRLLVASGFALGATFASLADAQLLARNLADLSLEELGNIEITSVSKRGERLSEAPASVFVITAEDVRRSGAKSLPEALRLAPNLQVAQVSASSYAISARGFNSTSANKLLVLIDGRSVYTPLFSGVFWDVQDVLLEDIERIEVISGPAGTLWGSNAVNGVINVITRAAKTTQGALIAGGAGNRESNVAARYGAAAGGDGHFRVYGQYLDRNGTATAAGIGKDDASYKAQAGFRADWLGKVDQLTVEGNVYRGLEGQPLPGSISLTTVPPSVGPIPVSGVNLLARWERALDDGAQVSLQAYYDRTERTVPVRFDETLDILDVQFQHSLRLAGMHTLAWGAEFRYGMDRVVNSNVFAFLPADVNQKWTSLFAQDDIALRPDLRVTVGGRLERNDYTGTEFLPNVRLAWKFAPDHLLWTAASRAARSPSRLDHDAFFPGQPPFVLAGGSDVRSEIADVYEIGYRGQLAPKLSFSATGFYARYYHLRTQELAPSHTAVVFASEMEGSTAGLEIWGIYHASSILRLSGGLSGLRERLTVKPGSFDTNAPAGAGRDPAQSWLLRSSLDLPAQTELDFTMRHVSALSNPVVPEYTAVDVRVGWRPRSDLELSVTGQNLFDGGHGEFTDVSTRTEFGRSVFFKIASRF
jgi:iron complex outermembrane receptor protein